MNGLHVSREGVSLRMTALSVTISAIFPVISAARSSSAVAMRVPAFPLVLTRADPASAHRGCLPARVTPGSGSGKIDTVREPDSERILVQLSRACLEFTAYHASAAQDR